MGFVAAISFSHLSFYIFIYIHIYLLLCLPVFLSSCPAIYPSLSLYICSLKYPSIYLLIDLFISLALFLCLFIHLSLYPSFPPYSLPIPHLISTSPPRKTPQMKKNSPRNNISIHLSTYLSIYAYIHNLSPISNQPISPTNLTPSLHTLIILSIIAHPVLLNPRPTHHHNHPPHPPRKNIRAQHDDRIALSAHVRRQQRQVQIGELD